MIKTSELPQALSILSAAIGKTNTMPILSCVRIDASDNQATMTASNLEMEITCTVAGETKGEMATCINFAKLQSFTTTAKNEAISLSVSGDKLKAKAKAQSTFTTLPFDNFPAMLVEHDGQISVDISGAALSNAINNIIYCVAKNDVRYYLNGMVFQIANGTLTLTASDGHRLATTSINVDTTESIDCIVNANVAATLANLFKDGNVSLTLSKNSLSASNGNIRMIAKNIDARYPDFSKIFKMERVHEVVVDKLEWIAAIQSVIVTANPQYKGITLEFSGDNKVTLSSFNEGEETTIELPSEHVGLSFNLGVNAEYLLAAAKKSSGKLNLLVDEKMSSIMIKDSGEATHIVMPMRI